MRHHRRIPARSRRGFLGSVIGGGLVLLIAIAGVFWNENRAVTTTRSLHEGRAVVASVPGEPVDAGLDGKLVHIQGQAEVTGKLRDPSLGIERPAVKLRRVVEMFQWVERGGGKRLGKNSRRSSTPARYETRWDKSLHKSRDFETPQGHENPASFEFEGQEWVSERVTLGPRVLSPGLLGRWNSWEEVELLPADIDPLPIPGPLRVWGGKLYRGENPQVPRIGDLRIGYEVVAPGPVSLVAAQRGSSFSSFQTASGDALEFLHPGLLDVDATFAAEHSRNTVFTWAGRLGGFLVMWIAMAIFFSPLQRLASWIPFLGRLIESGIGLFAFLLAACTTLVVIAVAWFAVRPMLSIGLLVGGVVLALVGSRLGGE